MSGRATAVLLAVGSYAAAAAMARGEPRRDPADLAASLARPIALPGLWRQLRDASRRSDPAEAIAAGRTIARLLPEWTDGLVHVAWICALDLSREALDDATAVDRLTTAVGWLEEAAAARRAADPRAAGDLLAAAATLVETRAAHDPGLAAAFRRELGRDPAAVALALLERAAALDPAPDRDERRARATARLAVAAIRLGDLARAEATLAAAIDQLAAVDDPEARAEAAALRGLGPLGRYLDDRAARAALLDDPRTNEVGQALQDLADG